MHNPTPAPGDKNLQCPRCESTNTKFCYYNNYNLSQPRHFCRSCRRYWTRGGSLRNIPVGGGSRRHPKHNAANASMRGKRSAPDPRPPPPETHIQTTEPGFSPGSSATDIDRMLLNATGSFTALLCMEIFPPFDLLAVTNGGAAPLPEEERISFAL